MSRISFDTAHRAAFLIALALLISSVASVSLDLPEEVSRCICAMFGYSMAIFHVVNWMARNGKGWN